MTTSKEREFWTASANSAIDKLQRQQSLSDAATEQIRKNHLHTVAAFLAKPPSLVVAAEEKGKRDAFEPSLPMVVPISKAAYERVGDPDSCRPMRLNGGIRLDLDDGDSGGGGGPCAMSMSQPEFKVPAAPPKTRKTKNKQVKKPHSAGHRRTAYSSSTATTAAVVSVQSASAPASAHSSPFAHPASAKQQMPPPASIVAPSTIPTFSLSALTMSL